ncbi:hypothetical protein ACTFIZ_007463 [Dictyostelium cf. discoideum]
MDQNSESLHLQMQKEKEEIQEQIQEQMLKQMQKQMQKEKEQTQKQMQKEKEQSDQKLKSLQNEKEQKTLRYLLKVIPKVPQTKSSSTTNHSKSIVGLKPDYWVIKKKTDFIGVIEIKRSDDVFNNNTIFGQVFDYLMGLSYLFCKVEAFALLTTYNEAMVVFTEDSKDLAASDCNELGGQTSKKRTRKIPKKINNASIASTKNNLNTIERKLYHSQRVNLDNLKKYLEFTENKIRYQNKRAYQFNTTQERGFTRNSPLGGGSDGFCWLASTIKVHEYIGKNHLVMPFFKIVGPDDYIDKKEEFDRLVSIACQTFAEKGYQRDAFKLRHIAKYTNQNNETKYIFIDLTRVSDIDRTKEAINNDIKINYDHEALTPTQSPTPSPEESLNRRFCNPFTIQETPDKK